MIKEVLNLLKQCIPEIEDVQGIVSIDTKFKYNGVTYQVKCFSEEDEEVKIVPCDIGKYLEVDSLDSLGIISKQEDGSWMFNFADFGETVYEPFVFTLKPEHAEKLKEYLVKLSKACEQNTVLNKAKLK